VKSDYDRNISMSFNIAFVVVAI